MDKAGKKFIVFLDIDGVLNSDDTCERTPEGYTGIDDMRVEILAKTLKHYKEYEIVLVSDWKNIKETGEDYVYLIDKLAKYDLKISDKTKDLGWNRGEGVSKYLEGRSDVWEYVILDDKTFDYSRYTDLWHHLLLTDGIELASPSSDTMAVEAVIFCDWLMDESKLVKSR